MSFDLVKMNFSQAGEAGTTVNLVLPDGTESDATVTILGDLSSTVKNFGRRKYKEIKSQVEAAKRRGKEWEPTLEEAEQSAVESALVRLIGWDGFTENGKKVEFSKDKAQEVLTQHPWIREFIIEQASIVANFTPRLKSNN